MNAALFDLASYGVIVVAALTGGGTVWMWALYLGPDNPPPRSRLLFVLSYVGTLISLAELPLAALATRRLQGAPTLGVTGGYILVGVILTLATAYLIIVAYLFWLRRTRKPPFE